MLNQTCVFGRNNVVGRPSRGCWLIGFEICGKRAVFADFRGNLVGTHFQSADKSNASCRGVSSWRRALCAGRSLNARARNKLTAPASRLIVQVSRRLLRNITPSPNWFFSYVGPSSSTSLRLAGATQLTSGSGRS